MATLEGTGPHRCWLCLFVKYPDNPDAPETPPGLLAIHPFILEESFNQGVSRKWLFQTAPYGEKRT